MKVQRSSYSLRKRLLAIYTTERYVRAVEGVYQRLLSAAPVPRAEGR